MRLDRVAFLALSTSLTLHASFAVGFDRLLFARLEGRKLPQSTRMKLVYYQTAEGAAAPAARAASAAVRTHEAPRGAYWASKELPRNAPLQPVRPAPAVIQPTPTPTPRPAAGRPEVPVVENLDLTDERVSTYFYDYYGLLSRAIREHAAYPPPALARGLAGETEVSFTLRRDGEVRSAKLTKSSGVRELDQGALDAVRGASPLPAIPSTLDVEELRLRVPIRFDRGS